MLNLNSILQIAAVFFIIFGASEQMCTESQKDVGCCDGPFREHNGVVPEWQLSTIGGGSWIKGENWIQFNIDNDIKCGGVTSVIQKGSATIDFYVGQAETIVISMQGVAESQYEKFDLYVDNALKASVQATDGLNNGCKVSTCIMCDVSMPSQEFDVSIGNHTIRIEMDTRDGIYHNNAYFRMDFLIKQKEVCGACTCPTVNTAPGAVALTASPSNQPTAFPTSEPSFNPTEACTVQSPVDIIFVVDGSKSVGANGFELSKQFVGEVADRFTISPSDTQIGIVQFSSAYQQELSVSQGKDLGNIHNALNAMTHLAQGTYTSTAIEFASSLFNNDRPSAKRVMIVLTDGQSGDFEDLPKAKAVAASLGITMMSVGVGSGIGIYELKATADKDDYVFTMNDFNALVAAVDDFSTEVCEIINLLTASPSVAPTNEPTVVILDEVLLDSREEESTIKIPGGWVLILAIVVAVCIVCTCWIVMDDSVIKCCCPCCVCCCVKKSEDEDEECPKLEESGSRLAQLKATE